jgi:predicted metal-dependent peptidase
MSAKTPAPNSRLPHTTEFKDTAAVLMMNAPFFASLFMRYKHVATESIPTLAVGVKTFMYNPTFLKSLPPEGRLAAFAHEVMHGVFQHVQMGFEYKRSQIGPDGKPLDFERWAQAIDYCVNGQVKEAGIGEVQKNWYCDTQRFPTTMTPVEIYEKLEGQPPSASLQSPDEHGIEEDDEIIEEDGEPAITTGAVINAARVAKALGGKVPAGVERMIKDITRPPHDPWKVLRKRVSDVANGKDTTSCRKLNRKLIVRGIGAPGRDGYRLGNIGVIVDLSGSIGQRELDVFGSHLSLILQEYKPREVRIAWTDTDVHRLDTVKDMTQLRSAFGKPVRAGGGTDLEVAYDELGRCDLVIVFTDGYTPYRKSPKFPVIWAMTTSQVAPYGSTIALKGHI